MAQAPEDIELIHRAIRGSSIPRTPTKMLLVKLSDLEIPLGHYPFRPFGPFQFFPSREAGEPPQRDLNAQDSAR